MWFSPRYTSGNRALRGRSRGPSAGVGARASNTVLRIRCRSSSVYLATGGATGGAFGAAGATPGALGRAGGVQVFQQIQRVRQGHRRLETQTWKVEGVEPDGPADIRPWAL